MIQYLLIKQESKIQESGVKSFVSHNNHLQTFQKPLIFVNWHLQITIQMNHRIHFFFSYFP